MAGLGLLVTIRFICGPPPLTYPDAPLPRESLEFVPRDPLVLDRELFAHSVLGLRQSYRAILEALFGDPRLEERGIRVYDTAK